MIQTTSETSWDDMLSQSGNYRYYITAMYGENSESDPTNLVSVEFTATGIIDNGVIPEHTKLGSNYPNPFTDVTKMRFDLSKDGDALIEIYKVSGEKIRMLLYENANAGHYEVLWDGKDDQGRSVPAGVYIFQLKAGNYLHSRKMVLMR